ncbi:MAG TPA: DUF488 domain-containing protein [Longimicrobiales bacterium]|nr:DUF488 domain-containing protein [Longimicrobiales bacterium]
MTLYTIGFTEKSASAFFGLLTEAGVRTVADVRLKNTSQLAGFAKRDDLAFFLEALGRVGYEHYPELAPTKELFDGIKKGTTSWAEFSRAFEDLLLQRAVAKRLRPADFADACLLCSEHEPDRCHRRLVAEHLASAWEDVDIVHLT